MKRFLSIILAAVMVIALLPSAFATTETGKTVYKYEFTLAGAGKEATITYENNNYLGSISAMNVFDSEGKIVDGVGNDTTEEGDDWSYVGGRKVTKSTADGTQAQLTTDGFWWYIYGSASAAAFANNGLVFKITVEETGTYIPTVKYLPHHDLTGNLYAFLIDPSLEQVDNKVDFVDDAVDSVYYVLNENKWQGLFGVQLAASGAMVSRGGVPSSENISELTGGTITLEKGDYYLLLAEDSTQRYAPYINSFELEKVPSLTIAASATTVEMGKTVTITPTFADTTADKITYTSSNNAVTVTKNTDGSATVTGVSKGMATITASVDGYDVSASVDIEVIGEITKYEFTLAGAGETENATETNSVLGNVKRLRAKTVESAESIGNDSTEVGADWNYLGTKGYYVSTDTNYQVQLTEKGFFGYRQYNTYINLGSNGLIFELNVPEDGMYIPSLNAIPSYTTTLHAFLIDEDINGKYYAMEGEDKLYDFGTNTQETVESVTSSMDVSKSCVTPSEIKKILEGSLSTVNEDLDVIDTITTENTIELRKGTYYLLIMLTDSEHTTYNWRTYINSFELEKVGELPLQEVSFAYSINGATPRIQSIERGKSVTASAPETIADGEKTLKFRHWVRGADENGEVVSKELEHTFQIMTNTYLTAVYAEQAAEGEKIVEFYNWNGDYLSQAKVNDDGKVDLPSDPKMTGYTFLRWIVDKIDDETIEFKNADITADVTHVVAEFNAETNYTVGQTTYSYDEEVKNTSTGGEAAWYRDGVLVGYGTEYIYNVWNNVSVIKSGSFQTKLPVIVLDGATKDVGDDKAYMIEFDAADEEIVEAGILFGKEGTTPSVESCEYKATSKKKGEGIHGQFTAKAPSADYTVARGYIIYNDNGVYRTAYSDNNAAE